MINSIKFRMGSSVSIPIYADWIKNKSVNVEGDGLVISVLNGVPVDIATALSELNLGYVIYARNRVKIASIEQSIEQINNAMELDLYRRTMNIGFVDPIELTDLDRWSYTNGIPVELRLKVKVLTDNSGSIGLSVRADDDVSFALMQEINSVAGDNYVISSSDNVETIHDIDREIEHVIPITVSEHIPFKYVDQTLSDTKNNTIILNGNTELSEDVDMLHVENDNLQISADSNGLPMPTHSGVYFDNVNNGMLHIVSDGVTIDDIRNALSEISNNEISLDEEIDVHVGVSMIHGAEGEVGLVLRAYDSTQTNSIDIDTTTFTYIGQQEEISYAFPGADIADQVTITSSDTNVIRIVDGTPQRPGGSGKFAEAVGVGDAVITALCGQRRAEVGVTSVVTITSFTDDEVISADMLVKPAYRFAMEIEDQQGPQGTEMSAYAKEIPDNTATYCGALPTSGRSLYISLDNPGNYIMPYVFPPNCNEITVVLNNNVQSFKLFKFISTMEARFSNPPGYAEMDMFGSTFESTERTSTWMLNDSFISTNADSFGIIFKSQNMLLTPDLLDGCTISFWHNKQYDSNDPFGDPLSDPFGNL